MSNIDRRGMAAYISYVLYLRYDDSDRIVDNCKVIFDLLMAFKENNVLQVRF